MTNVLTIRRLPVPTGQGDFVPALSEYSCADQGPHKL